MIKFDSIQKIEFNGVEFAYPTRPTAKILKCLTFSLHKGENIAIVGRSGSGKSTIAQLLLRFYDPSQGSINFNGVSLKELDLEYLRNEIIGLVSQEPVLFGASIKENIKYGNLEATDEDIIDAAKKANAHEFIKDFPEGYDTFVGDRGHALSVCII
jgi:ATP-binding cassette subfamily B (MDR/TAP) protein 10